MNHNCKICNQLLADNQPEICATCLIKGLSKALNLAVEGWFYYIQKDTNSSLYNEVRDEKELQDRLISIALENLLKERLNDTNNTTKGV